MATSLRRLSEEDPTLHLERDPQTGEQLLSGMTQMHVEVAVDRLKRRFGVEVDLRQPRVPYLETIRKEAQGPRALQEADRRPRAIRRLPHRARAARRPHRLRVRGQDRRRRHPAELPARGRQGNPGGNAPGRAGGRAGAGRAGPARGRLVPHGRLVGDGVQDRRLDGLQAGLRGGRPGAARADHGGRRDRSRRHRRRRERRSQLAARATCRAWSRPAG